MKYALIIGNDEYEDPKLSKLKTPEADSQALAKALRDKDIGDFDDVSLLVNHTEIQVRRSISIFLSNKKPNDLVLIYFSGHGVLDDRGRLFLALKDTQVNLLKATSIPSNFISEEMDTCRSKRQIFILDCCHSGAFARGIKGTRKAITEATFEGGGSGRVVLTASDSTQYAFEGDQIITQTDHSLFTHFLLKGINSGEADINEDGQITLDEWYDYTYDKVISETPSQVPHKWSYNQRGDLVIAKNSNIKKKNVELPSDLINALESPFSRVREGGAKELGLLLYSNDRELVEIAKLKLEAMEKDDSRTVSLLVIQLLSEYENFKSPAIKEKATNFDNKNNFLVKKENVTEIQHQNKVLFTQFSFKKDLRLRDWIFSYTPVILAALGELVFIIYSIFSKLGNDVSLIVTFVITFFTIFVVSIWQWIILRPVTNKAIRWASINIISTMLSSLFALMLFIELLLFFYFLWNDSEINSSSVINVTVEMYASIFLFLYFLFWLLSNLRIGFLISKNNQKVVEFFSVNLGFNLSFLSVWLFSLLLGGLLYRGIFFIIQDVNGFDLEQYHHGALLGIALTLSQWVFLKGYKINFAWSFLIIILFSFFFDLFPTNPSDQGKFFLPFSATLVTLIISFFLNPFLVWYKYKSIQN